MTWIAYAAIGCWLVAVLCFLKAGFAASWDGLPWLVWAGLTGAAGLAFTLAAVFS